MDVKDAGVDENGHDDKADRSGQGMAHNLLLSERQVAENMFPKVVADQRQSQTVRVYADVFDAE